MTDEEVRRFESQRNARILQAVMALISLTVLVGITLGYVAYSQYKADQRWCSLMVSLDDRYQALPKDGRNLDAERFAAQVHALRRDLHCPPTSGQVIPSTPTGTLTPSAVPTRPTTPGATPSSEPPVTS